jgi:DNA processing protein
VAMVGTRAASYYGLKAARRLALELAERGVTVVSGLARGIDTAAHQGALEGGGRTWAVLGCGPDVVYPAENRELYRRIAEQGALISEFPLGAPPEAKNFPIRNRIISGLSLAVVVVEAGEKSGTHITVRYALDQGREVMAVPGPVDAPTSLGPHRLIQEGAKLVQRVEDILAELRLPRPVKRPAAGAPPPPRVEGARPGHLTVDDPVLPFLGAEPVQLEELVQLSRLPVPEVMSRLTMLELQGLVRELPGKCFVLDN